MGAILRIFRAAQLAIGKALDDMAQARATAKAARASASTSAAGAAGVRFMSANSGPIAWARDNIGIIVWGSVAGIAALGGAFAGLLGIDALTNFFGWLRNKADEGLQLFQRWGSWLVIGGVIYIAYTFLEKRK